MTGEEIINELKKYYLQSLTEQGREVVSGIEKLIKENKSLGERVLQLEKDKGKLIDENRELKTQTEYMRCCENCKYTFSCDGVELCDWWELM